MNVTNPPPTVKRFAAHTAGQSRLAFIDGIRGVAAMTVVVGHALSTASPRFGPLGSYLGRAGVVAFFLVSGYVVTMSLHRQSNAVFWTRRVWRLYPVYWLAVAIYIAASGQHAFDAMTWALNIVMIQGFVGATTILPVAWTLGDELVIYMQQSVIGRWLRPGLLVNLGWLWLGLFALLAIVTRETPHEPARVSRSVF